MSTPIGYFVALAFLFICSVCVQAGYFGAAIMSFALGAYFLADALIEKHSKH